ncbi:hypothetical protein [Rubritalea tangerina]|uniref:hypothetical protein n=1 Tax=Rubritalea tangerina TaxID=430798 RepID=UPI00362443BB
MAAFISRVMASVRKVSEPWYFSKPGTFQLEPPFGARLSSYRFPSNCLVPRLHSQQCYSRTLG